MSRADAYVEQATNSRELVIDLRWPFKLATGAELAQVKLRRANEGDWIRYYDREGNERARWSWFVSHLAGIAPGDGERMDPSDTDVCIAVICAFRGLEEDEDDSE